MSSCWAVFCENGASLFGLVIYHWLREQRFVSMRSSVWTHSELRLREAEETRCSCGRCGGTNSIRTHWHSWKILQRCEWEGVSGSGIWEGITQSGNLSLLSGENWECPLFYFIVSRWKGYTKKAIGFFFWYILFVRQGRLVHTFGCYVQFISNTVVEINTSFISTFQSNLPYMTYLTNYFTDFSWSVWVYNQ